MAKGASTTVFNFVKYEKHLIKRVDKNSVRRREFVIKTTKALKFTTCSIIIRKRKHIHKQRLMN